MAVRIREINHIVVFDVEGNIRRSEADAIVLHQCVKDQLELGKKQFLFNLEKVDFVDSFGVGEFIASFTSAHNLGGTLKLMKIPKRLLIIFQVTGLIRIFGTIYEDEETALKSFI
ncbi:MAG: STAS domain-containing protein [Candidatus Aminicenantes bacterium]|jgi:anti-anti-sigma factor|nr:STAS domain-containing protein [Candidatus Aminicenantes bacterium]